MLRVAQWNVLSIQQTSCNAYFGPTSFMVMKKLRITLWSMLSHYFLALFQHRFILNSSFVNWNLQKYLCINFSSYDIHGVRTPSKLHGPFWRRFIPNLDYMTYIESIKIRLETSQALPHVFHSRKVIFILVFGTQMSCRN